MYDTTDPHTAHPTVPHDRPVHGQAAQCTGCARTIWYAERPDPQPGQPAGGWRHRSPWPLSLRGAIRIMADRMADSRVEAIYAIQGHGSQSPEYQRACRARRRQVMALDRLLCAVPLDLPDEPDEPTTEPADPSEVACTCGAALDIRPRWGAGIPAEAGLWQWLHADGSTPADHTPRPAAGGDRR